jgi:integrase
MKLTDLKCKASKPNLNKKAPTKISDGDGLYFVVHSTGKKTWRFDYRYHGKQKTMSFGPYPLVSLKEARDKRIQARKLLSEHKDPILEKDKSRKMSKISSENNFEKVAREWYENRKHMWKPRYAKEIIKRLEEDIFPFIGNYPIAAIDRPLLLSIIRRIEDRGAVELAKRQLQKCGEVFRYAIACGIIQDDPTFKMWEALKPVKKQHFACLELKEMPDFLKALARNDARLHRSTRNALRLIMLTFVRTNELINAPWTEIDWENKQWVIPPERMKTGNEHIVPLSSQSLEILRDQKEITGHWPLIFASPVKPQKSISNNTILGAIKRLGYQGRMTGHGFRALAMTGIKEELEYPHEIVDRQLAHVHANKTRRAYDRAVFLKERTEMMQKWADLIDELGQE